MNFTQLLPLDPGHGPLQAMDPEAMKFPTTFPAERDRALLTVSLSQIHASGSRGAIDGLADGGGCVAWQSECGGRQLGAQHFVQNWLTVFFLLWQACYSCVIFAAIRFAAEKITPVFWPGFNKLTPIHHRDWSMRCTSTVMTDLLLPGAYCAVHASFGCGG